MLTNYSLIQNYAISIFTIKTDHFCQTRRTDSEFIINVPYLRLFDLTQNNVQCGIRTVYPVGSRIVVV